MMKAIIFQIIKIIISATISLAILSGFCLFYYNPPVSVKQTNLSTNYRYAPNKYWSVMTEGFGYGKIDNNGYNNTYFTKNENPDVLIMGSSQVEAMQVSNKDNMTYQLNKFLFNDKNNKNDFFCYNIGIAGHSFGYCVSNFYDAVRAYPTAKYIIVETNNVRFNTTELNNMQLGSYKEKWSDKKKFYTLMQNIPYFRLAYVKTKEFSKKDNKESEKDKKTVYDLNDNKKYLNSIISNMKKICDEDNKKLIIMYHSTFKIDDSKTVIRNDEEKFLKIFNSVCENCDVTFVDATQNMIKNYLESTDMSYGFSNTTLGAGHLNKTGHKIIAKTLYDTIMNLEETK